LYTVIVYCVKIDDTCTDCRSEKQKTNTDDGRVYTWEGFTSAVPYLLRCPVSCVGIRTVSLGRNHGALLTVNGQLFMFGNNDSGQVGTGVDTAAVAVPRLVILPTGIL